MARRPAELALAFAFDAPRTSVIITVAASPAMIRPSHRGARSRRFPERAGRLGQPVANRRGLVVDDVVDARDAALDRDRGRLGGVLDV